VSASRIEFTGFKNANGPLTKRIYLRDGRIDKDDDACHMVRGTARRVVITRGMEDMADFINKMPSDEAYALGRLREDLPDQVEIVTQDRLDIARAKNPAVIARTKEFLIFKKGEPGIVLFDVDYKGAPAAIRRRLMESGGPGPLCAKFFPSSGPPLVSSAPRRAVNCGIRKRARSTRTRAASTLSSRWRMPAIFRVSSPPCTTVCGWPDRDGECARPQARSSNGRSSTNRLGRRSVLSLKVGQSSSFRSYKAPAPPLLMGAEHGRHQRDPGIDRRRNQHVQAAQG
jgi:hypothetical protein